MTGTEGEIVYTRDLSSGRVHKRIRQGNLLIPFGGESDNLDDAGRYEVITADMEGERCRRCFPDTGDPEEDA